MNVACCLPTLKNEQQKGGLSLLYFYNRAGLDQSCFSFFNQGGESQLVVNGDIGQDLAIDLDGSLLQTVDQTAVGQAVLTGCSVDTRNPQLTELTLLLATVTVGILTSFGYRLYRYAVDTGTGAVVTLGGFHYFLVTSASGHTTFNSWHFSHPPLCVRQTSDNTFVVGSGNKELRSQLTLTLAALLGQDVTQVVVLALEAT